MKKYFYCIVWLIVVFFSVSIVKANESIFYWEQTEIDVEYGSNIEDAVLKIKDGIKLKFGYADPDFYVDYDGVNYTYVHVMRTNVLKTYHLYYQAVSPRHNKKETKQVAFHIVDMKAPVVTSYIPIYVQVNSDKPNYLNYIKYVDDTTPEDKIKVIVDDRYVNYTKVGTYDLFYIFTDLFGNETVYQGEINIVDLISPTIEKIDHQKYIIGTPFNINNFFIVKDNYDQDLKLEYTINGTLTEEGIVEVTLLAKDSSGNITTLVSTIEVIQNKPPTVISSYPFTILIGEKKPDYIKFILYEDDLTPTEKIIVTVNDSGVRYDKVGEYEIVYKLIDDTGNETIYKEKIYIVDLISPIISKIENVYHELGTIFNIYDYFKVEDNYDINLEIEYKLKDSLEEIGKVEVYLSSTDSSGNKTQLNSYIEVIATKEPVLILYNEFLEVEVFSNNIDFLSYIQIGEHYGTLVLDDIIIESNIDYNLIGEYEVNYYLTDKYGNLSSKTLTVYIKDTEAPIIEVNNINIKQNEFLDLLSKVVVKDNYWDKEDIKVTIVESNLNTSVAGSYFVMYEAVDKSGNYTYKTINVYVENEEETLDYFIYIIGIIAVLSILGLGGYIYYKRNNKNKIKKRFNS